MDNYAALGFVSVLTVSPCQFLRDGAECGRLISRTFVREDMLGIFGACEECAEAVLRGEYGKLYPFANFGEPGTQSLDRLHEDIDYPDEGGCYQLNAEWIRTMWPITAPHPVKTNRGGVCDDPAMIDARAKSMERANELIEFYNRMDARAIERAKKAREAKAKCLKTFEVGFHELDHIALGVDCERWNHDGIHARVNERIPDEPPPEPYSHGCGCAAGGNAAEAAGAGTGHRCGGTGANGQTVLPVHGFIELNDYSGLYRQEVTS